MKTAIATVSIAGTLREKFAAIQAAGFDGVEIFEQDFLRDAASPAEVGAMARDHGLEIMLFQPFRDFEGLPGDLRARAFDRARHKFDLMAELGAPLMLICSSVHPAALGGIDRAADDLAELAVIAADRGLRIGYEALAWGRHVNDHRDAWEIVRRADHPNLGLILDSFHTLSRKIAPDTIRRIPGDKIFFVQLADAPLIDMDLLYWSRHFRNMPGEGDLPVTDFMRAVAATGYAGPLSLEIFNDQFRGGSPEGIARDGHRSLIWLMDQVRRTEPDVARNVPVLPPNITVDGIAFVEFAASAVEQDRLASALRQMGFYPAAQHRNKQVTVWQQGDIRIVINTEQTGFAHSFYLNHGTAVCDIGLHVGDARATVQRAQALGARVFDQPVGPGEVEIPAIRGVGGSVLHFIDDSSAAQIWQGEFDPLPGDGAGFGLTRVDHLAETMNYDEMLSWTLFYSSIFDMQRRPMLDVADPDGLVRSQAIAAPDGRARITLNGTQSHRTLAGSFLTESMGSVVQHIALESRDIFVTAQQMADAGFAALEIPENYYADLRARFGMEDETLAHLQSLNILYDRDDDGGEFFQLYGRPITGGLFFEIVQRRGGYDGYGAYNAPFRIAALKRLMRGKSMPRA
ncbi:MAG: TIM barrel protein [Paracoccus sp. (in: a-proteobacteria)]|uniref:bifunctional sugar phosphate isomerase/epimerase/4-hydroxyphenylpyruvate dioxygenase family protein n=1 Tax=Paracoccus sp. TaxID=267 RepID=UPI0026E024B0|nr:sugar phosphate isomerase/epimerase and 4-hydroxyphenylpyruvate domain-containing protein [Paracoccus sp. (in: a-proteobacteria)]MDO5631223.1 TIM barrel protein [Paracoccus sp. (in: a-proteobacteria)]